MLTRSSNLSIKRVLVPTDFSEPASRTLDDALAVAEALEASLHILHVVVPYDPYTVPTADIGMKPQETLLEAMLSAARDRMDDLLRKVSSSAVDLEGSCRQGTAAADAIVDFCAEEDIDLIVLSSHGRRGFRRLFLGSVTEEVIRRATCPVLVQRRDPAVESPTQVRRLLVPVDFSNASRESLGVAVALAPALGAKAVDLLTVIHQPVYPGFYGAGAVPTVLQHSAEVEAANRKELEEWAQRIPETLRKDEFLRRGDVAVEIVNHATERDCGLIVLSSRGLSGLSRLLLGSVAEKVLRRAECPVLVVPAAMAETDEEESVESGRSRASA